MSLQSSVNRDRVRLSSKNCELESRPALTTTSPVGDAMVTGEVFLRMIPLLAEKGVRTLGQAREASEKTYNARLKY